MPSSRWNRILKQLYDNPVTLSPVERSKIQLELELQNRFRQIYKQEPHSLSRWHWRVGLHRLIVATSLGLALIIGACQIPVDWDLVLGQQMAFMIPTTPDLHQHIQTLTQSLESIPGVERIAVQVRDDGGKQIELRLEIWGENLGANELQAHISQFEPQWLEHFMTVQPLKGTVHTSLGQKIGHQIFDLDLDSEDIEIAREHILMELAEQGVDGDIEVKIEEQDDGHRRIEVRVHKEEYIEGPNTNLPK